MLPKPKSKYGYTSKEIEKICDIRGVFYKDFWNAFGINTCALVKGIVRYYVCDVENAFWKLKHRDGKYHEWD